MTRLPSGTVESKASSISSHPAPRILRFENHDEALRFWRESAGANRILVHVDAHHDMWWADPGQRVTIANFISPALQEGILREIYWVVPGSSWESAENRRQIFHHLRRIQEGFPIRPARLEIAHDHISTTLFGKALHICSVEGLPKFGESVLLDLDVDYLIFPRVTYGPGDPHPALPWRWPADLVQILNARGVQSDLVTIACSIEGGYTPLRWKYLGDELEVCLTANISGDAARGMGLMRRASETAASGDRAAAEEIYVHAAALLPRLAAPLWHLAFLYLDCGRIEEAQTLYHRALDLDPTYRTAHNNDGLWHYWGERRADSEREYRRTVALDPRDAFSHLGLGWLAMEESRWGEAESELQRAIDIDPDLLDAHRALGRIFLKMGRLREAIAAYEKSLKLSLSGRVSLRDSPVVSAEQPRWNDLSHFSVFLRLGQLYRATSEPDRASQFLRMAAAAGLDSAPLRLELASLAFRKGKWGAGLGEIGKAFAQAAMWAGRVGKKILRRLKKPFLYGYEFWRVR
jgi:tetratricopeptide (TPR) repeat protein